LQNVEATDEERCLSLMALKAVKVPSAIGTTPQLAQKLVFRNSDLDKIYHRLGQSPPKQWAICLGSSLWH